MENIKFLHSSINSNGIPTLAMKTGNNKVFEQRINFFDSRKIDEKESLKLINKMLGGVK